MCQEKIVHEVLGHPVWTMLNVLYKECGFRQKRFAITVMAGGKCSGASSTDNEILTFFTENIRIFD